jgi:hypothetical protein
MIRLPGAVEQSPVSIADPVARSGTSSGPPGLQKTR